MKVSISWSAPTETTDLAASYNVYRSLNGGAFTLLNTSPVTGLSYVDTNVAVGEQLSYEITAVDSNGIESPTTAAVSVSLQQPGPPTNVRVVVGN
jgi:fibronectin type 3 domain-containing protein